MPLEHRTLYIVEFNKATPVFKSDLYVSIEYEFKVSDNLADLFDLSNDPYSRYASSVDRPSEKTSLGAAEICNEIGLSSFDIEPTRGNKANVSNGQYKDAIEKLEEFLEDYDSVQKAREYTGSSKHTPFEIAEALANHNGFPDLLIYDKNPPHAPKFLAEVKLGNDNITDSQHKFFKYFRNSLPIAKILISRGIKVSTDPDFESQPGKVGRCPNCQSLSTTVDLDLRNNDIIGFKCSTCSNMFLARDKIPIVQCELCGGEHVADQGIYAKTGKVYCNDSDDYFEGEIELQDSKPRYGY